ncbi:MAG: hypothetical protein ACOC6M_05295 [Halobacteriota archaeon]
MATCKDCKHSKPRAGYWICEAVGRCNPMLALDIDGVETCDYFEPRVTPFFFQSTLSRYIEEVARI